MSTPYMVNASQIALPPPTSAAASAPVFDGNPEFSLPPAGVRRSGSEAILIDFMRRCWNAVRKILETRQIAKKHLRVCETAALGDKRFVAVVQVDGERFLIGGAANSLALLARLSDSVSSAVDTQDHSEKSQDQQR